MEGEREFEETVTRTEAATSLRGLADGVDAGSIRFDIDEGAVDVVVPDEVGLEIELEQEEDGIEIEVELEWEDSEIDLDSDGTREDPVEEDEGESETETASKPEMGDSEERESEEGEMGTPTEKRAGEDRPLLGAAEPTESLARFEVFRDRADEWRWRLVHRNGNIIATSGESYTQKHNARNGLQSVMSNSPDAEVVDEDGFE